MNWHERQADAVELLRRLERDWGPTEFEQQKDGSFIGERCGICGKRWKKSGMHICAPVEFREEYTERYLESRGSAFALALEALWRWRLEYTFGHNVWKKGEEMMFEVTGEAKRDHLRYEELTKAIKELE
ncbi:unnamed protein product [marine sediment metagenome]|uniref:Uncharacterized protein n=1 Tax=marine sediment metagenome TaxID=412755 RepID=X1GSD9_9ZZZZ